MATLIDQIEIIDKQRLDLLEKIKIEEERKRKDGYTLERLEAWNKDGYERRNYLRTRKKIRGVEGTSELIMITHTNTRFDIILEIFKKQDARIQELEEIIRNK